MWDSFNGQLVPGNAIGDNFSPSVNINPFMGMSPQMGMPSVGMGMYPMGMNPMMGMGMMNPMMGMGMGLAPLSRDTFQSSLASNPLGKEGNSAWNFLVKTAAVVGGAILLWKGGKGLGKFLLNNKLVNKNKFDIVKKTAKKTAKTAQTAAK